MKGIREILTSEGEKKSKNIGERHLIVGEIDKKLKETSYKRISLPLLGKLLSVYKGENDLRDLHRKCIDSKNYAAMFWWHFPKKPKMFGSLKVKGG